MALPVPSDVLDDFPELVQSQASSIMSQDSLDFHPLVTPPPESEAEHTSSQTDVDQTDTNSDLDDEMVHAYVSAVGRAVFNVSKEQLVNDEQAIIYYTSTNIQVIVSSNVFPSTNKGGPLDSSRYGTVDCLWERCRDAMCPWYPDLSEYEGREGEHDE
ncbi:hypothetical protein PM082_023638 [Marasmius tenuissimus]|nr:hypothetical protein PM082_023638 [Marasmius tenuissimus]